MLTYIANRYIQTVRMINFEEQLLMAYGGLRGAIAFSLAIMLEENHVKHARIFITTSLFIVLFTVFVLGSTTKPVVRWLEVQLHVNTETSMFIEINNKVVETVMSGIEEVAGHRSVNYWNQKLNRFNEKYLKGILTRGDGHSFKDTFELIYAGFIPQRPKPHFPEGTLNTTGTESEGIDTEEDTTGLTFGMDSSLANNNNETCRVMNSQEYFLTEGSLHEGVEDNESRRIITDPSYSVSEKENISSTPTDKSQETTFIHKMKDHMLDRSTTQPPHVSKSESCLEYQHHVSQHSHHQLRPHHDKRLAITTASTSTTTTSTITISTSSPSKKRSSFKELIRVGRLTSSSSATSVKLSRSSLEEVDLERRFIASAFSRSAYYQLPERDEVDSDFSSTTGKASPGSHHHLTPGDTITGATASGGSTGSGSPSSATRGRRESTNDDLDSFGSSTASKKWASARLKLEKLAISPIASSSKISTGSKHSKTAPSTPSVLLTVDKTSTPLKGSRQEGSVKEFSDGNVESKEKTSKDPLTGSASLPLFQHQQHQNQHTPRVDEKHGKHLHEGEEDTKETSHETTITLEAVQVMTKGEQSVTSSSSGDGKEKSEREEGCINLSHEELEPLRRVLLSKRKSKQFQDLAEALLQQKKMKEGEQTASEETEQQETKVISGVVKKGDEEEQEGEVVSDATDHQLSQQKEQVSSQFSMTHESGKVKTDFLDSDKGDNKKQQSNETSPRADDNKKSKDEAE